MVELTKSECEIILKALDYLIDFENDVNDYSKIVKKLKQEVL